jgi:type IV secretion system protein VirB1
MIDAALIEACAPHVAAETVQAIVKVESQGDPIALASNRPGGAIRLHPKDLDDAIRLARREIAAGSSVDMGLMQVNSRNLAKLALTIEQIWEPCTNLRAGAVILTGAYFGAMKEFGEGQAALRAALSAYNTGNFIDGLNNGYVARYYTTQRGGVAASPYTVAEIYAADPVVFTREVQKEPTMPSQPRITSRDFRDFPIPGVEIELNPIEAEQLGIDKVIEEHTVSSDDAWDAQFDGPVYHDGVGAEDERVKTRAKAERAYDDALTAHDRIAATSEGGGHGHE